MGWHRRGGLGARLRHLPRTPLHEGPCIRIREIVDASDPALRDAYALLRQAFHKEERVPLSEWKGSLAEKSSRLLTDIAWHLLVAEDDGSVVGLASGTYLGNLNIGVIGYLAMAPAARAHGMGSRLRARLRRLFARDAQRLGGRPLDGIVGEVSAGNPWLQTLARRPEVLLLDFPYLQPSLHEDDDPSSFILYYESLQSRRDRIPVAELRRILYGIWRRVYRISRPLDHRAFRTMLRSLERRRTVGRRRIPSPASP